MRAQSISKSERDFFLTVVFTKQHGECFTVNSHRLPSLFHGGWITSIPLKVVIAYPTNHRQSMVYSSGGRCFKIKLTATTQPINA